MGDNKEPVHIHFCNFAHTLYVFTFDFCTDIFYLLNIDLC